MPQLIHSEPRTQKAIGIKLIASRHLGHGLSNEYVQAAHLVRCEISGIIAYLSGLRFFRPCPETPMHGFVDSRPIDDAEESLRRVLWETFSADSNAELIAMKPIHAMYSGILTPDGVALGPGNDGATGGHGSMFIPCGVKTLQFAERALGDHWSVSKLLAQAQIVPVSDSDGKKTWPIVPYMEIVSTGQSVECVQLRGGDSGAVASDWSPVTERCNTIRDLEKDYDALKFEKWAKAHAGESGLVIWQDGGNGVSHAAVHCRANRLHYRATVRPCIGDMLVKAEETPKRLRRFRTILRQIIQEAHTNRRNPMDLQCAIAATHTAALCRFETQAQARLIARALVSILAHATACLLGELRHWNSAGPGKAGKGLPVDIDALPGLQRDQVYEKALTNPFTWIRTLRRVVACFATKGWSGSYGGKKWARCGRQAVGLAIAIRQCATSKEDQKCEKYLLNAISKAHNLVNLCHHGGPFFNKFGLEKSDFSRAAQCPQLDLVQPPTWLACESTDAECIKASAVNKLMRLEKVSDADKRTLGKVQQIWICLGACHEHNGQFRVLPLIANPTSCYKHFAVRVQIGASENDYHPDPNMIHHNIIAAMAQTRADLPSKHGTDAKYAPCAIVHKQCCAHATRLR
jgi:hypothetical protein